MSNSRLICAAIICMLLTGCEVKPGNPADRSALLPVKSTSSLESVKATESPVAKGQDVRTGLDSANSKEETSVEQPQQSQASIADGKKLNFDALNRLDNTKYSWWLKLNKEHRTPEIPLEAKTLIDKNGGIYVGDTSKKKVYLTFDEGYENGYTASILDTLKANNVKAIFFVTGPYIREQELLVRRMLEEGHAVGNHTINHPSLPDVGNEALENEMYGLEKDFRSRFGIGFKYIRPPKGEYSERTLAAAQQLGYKTVFWSFAYDDWDNTKSRGADYAHDIVMANLHNGAIILLHAVSKDNAEALDRIIKDIKAQGYEISPFDL